MSTQVLEFVDFLELLTIFIISNYVTRNVNKTSQVLLQRLVSGPVFP